MTTVLSSAALALFASVSVGCGGIVVVDAQRSAWDGPDGVAAPIPPDVSGSSWEGWWVRFPGAGGLVDPIGIATLGDDVVLLGDGTSAAVNKAFGPISSGDPQEAIRVCARVTPSGEVVWAKPTSAQRVVSDGQRLRLPLLDGTVQTLDGSGDVVDELKIAGGQIGSIGATHDGGYVLALVAETDAPDFGAGPIALDGPLPASFLTKFSADGTLEWSKQASNELGAVGLSFVAEDPLGRVLVMVSGSGEWNGAQLDAIPNAQLVATIDATGDLVEGPFITGDTFVSGPVPVEDGGFLFSEGAIATAAPATINGVPVPYDDAGSYEPVGLVFGFDSSGTLLWQTTFVDGIRSVAVGPGAMWAGAQQKGGPLMANWCSGPSCDTYAAAETEAWGEHVAVPAGGDAVYVVGTGRPTPGGDQSAPYQLFVMRLTRH